MTGENGEATVLFEKRAQTLKANPQTADYNKQPEAQTVLLLMPEGTGTVTASSKRHKLRPVCVDKHNYTKNYR